MINIVQAAEKHISEIDELWLEFMHFHQEIDKVFTVRDGAIPGFENDVVRRLMKSEDGLVLVALDEGRVIGFALSEIRGPAKVYKLERYGAIDTMAVTSSYRRRGVGKAMLREILTWFRSKDIDRVELEVLAKNIVSNSFWRKQGFMDYRYRLFRNI
jgi:ribosomal protein S18 acetylase RimI-like enzyme